MVVLVLLVLLLKATVLTPQHLDELGPTSVGKQGSRQGAGTASGGRRGDTVAGTTTNNHGFDPNGQPQPVCDTPTDGDGDGYLRVGDTAPTSQLAAAAESAYEYSRADEPPDQKLNPNCGDSVDYAVPYDSVAVKTGGQVANLQRQEAQPAAGRRDTLPMTNNPMVQRELPERPYEQHQIGREAEYEAEKAADSATYKDLEGDREQYSNFVTETTA
jgi:hypothetical protein